MDQIEHPSKLTWEERRKWFEGIFDIDAHGGSYIIGEHAAGLLVDFQAIYCAGAFVSVLIVACTIVDAHLRETEFGLKFNGSIQETFAASRYESDLEWLRKRRNELVHFNANRPLPTSIDDQWSNRLAQEADARFAIELVANVLFENPWI